MFLVRRERENSVNEGNRYTPSTTNTVDDETQDTSEQPDKVPIEEGEESDPEPDKTEVEHIKRRITSEGFVPLIDLQTYNISVGEHYNAFHEEGLLYGLDNPKADPLPFTCSESLFTPPSPSSAVDLEVNIANIMNFLEQDTEDTKKRMEYEKRAREIDWENLEYQNSQTDYLAELSQGSNREHSTQDSMFDE